MRRAFNQIKGKVQGVKKILKITLDVQNVDGLGVKVTTKEGKLEAKFELKLKFP